MVEHERIFSSIAAYVGKLAHVELRNDLQAGTMTVVFKSSHPTEGALLALKIYGTRNVEISVTAPLDWKNFRRGARVYANALELIDCFHLIEVEEAAPEDPQSVGKGGLRIARALQQSK